MYDFTSVSVLHVELKRKDPGVPNSLPFKEEILLEAKRQQEKVC